MADALIIATRTVHGSRYNLWKRTVSGRVEYYVTADGVQLGAAVESEAVARSGFDAVTAA